MQVLRIPPGAFIPSGPFFVVDLSNRRSTWLVQHLNKQGCLVFEQGGRVFVGAGPRAKKLLAQALDQMPEPEVLVLVPTFSEDDR